MPFNTQNLSKLYSGYMLVLLCGLFLLNHSNQNSSQSTATIFLLCSPFILLLKQHVALPVGLKLFVTTCTLTFVYSLLLFFQEPPTDISYSTLRGLNFYLLAAGTVLLLWKSNLSKKAIFALMVTGTIFSLYPVLREAISNAASRGSVSAHPIFWGNVCLTTGVVAFTLSRDHSKELSPNKILGMCALAFGSIASFWSLTRGGWISIPFAVLLFYTFGLIKKSHVIAIAASVIILFSSSDSLRGRVLATFNHFENGIALDESTSLRVQMWDVSFNAFQKNPMTGLGLDGYSEQNKEELAAGKVSFYFDHAHNEFLEILASRGIIGVMIFLFMVTSLAATYYKNRQSIYAKAGLIALMQYMIYSLSETFFTTKFTLMYFVTLHSFLLVAMYKEQYGLLQKYSESKV